MSYPDIGHGWCSLGFMPANRLTRRFQKNLLEKFADALYCRSVEGTEIMGNEVYEVFVRGYEAIPQEMHPGGGFIAVGDLTRGEVLDESYLERLREIVKQGQNDCIVDFLVTGGPRFEPSNRVDGRYIKNPKAFRVIWMRWNFNKKVA